MKIPLRWRPVHTLIAILALMPLPGAVIALGFPVIGFILIIALVIWAVRIVIREDSNY